ncbi:PRD domain-containing protein [Clostridiales bacterium COT073_COT-073]|nr:PRD domain-containing protein [Clostridiales bacterium COT073_COT-073]
MEQLLLERLNILKEAEMLDEVTEKTVYHVINKLEADGVVATDENIGMFITHLIAAIRRIKSNEAIEEVNLELKEELMKNPFYPMSKTYFTEMKDVLGVDLDEAEKIYIGGYLCILLAKGKEGLR